MGADEGGVGAEGGGELGVGPEVKGALGVPAAVLGGAVAVGILGGEEAAGGVGQVAYYVIKYAARGPGVALVASVEMGVDQVDRDLRLVVEHFFKMRHEPGLVHGVAVEAAAKVIVQPSHSHVAEGGVGHLDGGAAGLGGGALEDGDSEEEIEVGGAGEFGCAAEAAVGGVEALVEMEVGAFEGVAGGFVKGWGGGGVKRTKRLCRSATIVLGEGGEGAVGFGDEAGAVVGPAFGDGVEQSREAGAAVVVGRRKIGAAVEGF